MSDKLPSYSRIVGSESTKCDTNFRYIQKILDAAVGKFNRQISLTIDISCCPKSLFVFILGYGLSKGLLKRINLFYAHTDYEGKLTSEVTSADNPSYKFTEGEWSAVQIPYLEGDYRPSALRKLIVTMGAEASVTESFIRRYQPDILNFIVPSPSATKKMDASILKEITALIRRLEISENETKNVHPHDMLGCVETCQSFVNDSSDSDISIVCLGTKPHAIASAVVATTSSQATLICRVPVRYKQTAGSPTGTASWYTIEDLSAF